MSGKRSFGDSVDTDAADDGSHAVDVKTEIQKERNKFHAKRAREKKKVQLELLHSEVLKLTEEKARWTRLTAELQTRETLELNHLMNIISTARVHVRINLMGVVDESNPYDAESSESDIDVDEMLPQVDRQQCSQKELDAIKRERNRLHAKRARQRKKKLAKEYSRAVMELEKEVDEMKIIYLKTIHLRSLMALQMSSSLRVSSLLLYLETAAPRLSDSDSRMVDLLSIGSGEQPSGTKHGMRVPPNVPTDDRQVFPGVELQLPLVSTDVSTTIPARQQAGMHHNILAASSGLGSLGCTGEYSLPEDAPLPAQIQERLENMLKGEDLEDAL